MAEFDQVMADTLAMVNVVRKAMGVEQLKELPSSMPGRATDCLFARALRPVGVMSVGGNGTMQFNDDRVAATAASYWGVEAKGTSVVAPPEFAQVIAKFDSREIPAVSTTAPSLDAPD